MKKLLICLLMSLFCTNISNPFHSNHTAYAQQKPIPPYAKWSNIALEKTKQKYPNAKIVDYLHIGRRSGQSTSTERFKFWLKENQKEFGVFVNIEFNNQTEQVVNVTFQETTR